MSEASDCIFCKIIRGEIPGRVIDRNAEVVTLLSLEGHPMIITREHLVDIFTMTDAQGAAVMSEAIRIARAMRDAIQPDGIHLAQSNGEAAGQEVFHLPPASLPALDAWPGSSDRCGWAGSHAANSQGGAGQGLIETRDETR